MNNARQGRAARIRRTSAGLGRLDLGGIDPPSGAVSPARWQDEWRRSDREAYRALKTQVRDTLIRRADAVFPGLRAAIEFEDAATPVTYEHYTGNTAGATSGWSWNPKQPFYEGGQFKTTVTTPVRNLLIGSCWAGQIGGIPNALAAAYLCAKKIG